MLNGGWHSAHGSKRDITNKGVHYWDARGTPGIPRFPLKGSFKGDIDIGIDIDVDIDLDARGT